MLFADTMAIFFVVVGLLISFNGVWLLARSVWSGAVARSVIAHEDSMWKSFLIGLPVTALSIFIFIALSSTKNGGAGLAAVLQLSIYLLFSSVGVAGLATIFGERLSRHPGDEAPWKATARGGSVLALSYLFPFMGWFIVLPITTVIGCGATIRAIWSSKRDRKSVEVSEAAQEMVG